MAYVIDTAKRDGGLWLVDGTQLGYCRASTSPGRLRARSSIGYFNALGGTGRIYCTTSVMAVFRNSGEWDNIRPLIISEVINDPMKIVGCKPYPTYPYPRYEHVLKDGAILSPPDPCDGVVCDPECDGVDLYDMVCEDGKCVRGALKEANNITTCGYVKPMCDEGDKRSPETCRNGTIIHKEVCSGNKWVPTGAICPTKPKPECTEGDKRPGEICSGGKWIPHTPEPPVPGEGRLYVKFAIPVLDLLPWIPYEPWMWIPPGFEVVEVNQG